MAKIKHPDGGYWDDPERQEAAKPEAPAPVEVAQPKKKVTKKKTAKKGSK